MNILTHTYQLTLFAVFSGLFLVSCSEDKNPTSSVSNEIPSVVVIPKTVEIEPPVITNPKETTSSTVENIEEEAILIMPKIKPHLTKKQLFAGALDAHNSVRKKHGLQPLTWSNKLASYSQQWANHLGAGKSCKMYHRSGSPPYGENLYISSAIVWKDNQKEVARERNRVNIRNVVKVWTDEEKWYDYKTNRCRSGKQCGHYTQVVWRETTEVGCAVKFCGDMSQNWVCSYNPPGNYVGKRPY